MQSHLRKKQMAVNQLGKMLEWLKRHAWKACIRLKRIAGSNPALSAKQKWIINKKNIKNY